MDISGRGQSCLPHCKSIQRDGGESARIREERHSFPNTKEKFQNLEWIPRAKQGVRLRRAGFTSVLS